MAKSIVTIKLSDLLTGSKVWIDGKEIHDIGAIHVEHVAGDISKVSLVLVPKSVIIEGKAEVHTLQIPKAHRHPYENEDCHCDSPPDPGAGYSSVGRD